MPGTSALDPLTGGDAPLYELAQEDRNKLQRWNLRTAILSLVTGVAIFVISDRSNSAPIFTAYADANTRGISDQWAPKLEKHGDAVVGYYSGTFLLIVAVDHFVVSTVGRRVYERELQRCRNPFRWVEYSVSAGVMHVEIAQLSGVLELHLLIAIFALTAVTMVFGYFQEVIGALHHGDPKRKSMLPFWLGCVPHVANWAIIFSFFFNGVVNGSPPAFVWAIIFILFGLDATFAVVQYLQQKEIGRFKNYLHGEYAFIILSFTSKQLLAWINYGGTNALNNDA